MAYVTPGNATNRVHIFLWGYMASKVAFRCGFEMRCIYALKLCRSRPTFSHLIPYIYQTIQCRATHSI
jgi:hypothetical protein